MYTYAHSNLRNVSLSSHFASAPSLFLNVKQKSALERALLRGVPLVLTPNIIINLHSIIWV